MINQTSLISYLQYFQKNKVNQSVKTSFQLNDVKKENLLANVRKKESKRNAKRRVNSAVSIRNIGTSISKI